MPVECRICRSRNTREFRFGATPLIRCSDCDIVFVRDMPTAEDLAAYYAREYMLSDATPAASESRRLSAVPEQIKLIAALSALTPAPAHILDIGCDKGYFLDEARRYGYSVRGVESSISARNYCRAIGIDVVGSLAELDPGERADAVVMWHALEHFPDPLRALKHIHSLLRAGGVLLVRVPDFRSLWSRLLKQRWIWFQPRNHCFHFSGGSLRTALAGAGFTVTTVESRRPNDGIAKQAQRLSRRTFKNYCNEKPSARKRLGRIYQNITAVELFAIARKSG